MTPARERLLCAALIAVVVVLNKYLNLDLSELELLVANSGFLTRIGGGELLDLVEKYRGKISEAVDSVSSDSEKEEKDDA